MNGNKLSVTNMEDFSESDIESDLEAELEDLRRLTAALEDDDAGPSRGASQFSINTSQSTFNSAPDDFVNIDTAIALNKLYDEKLQNFEKMLIRRLNECRQRLSEVQNTSTLDKPEKSSNSTSFRYINCGKPYFKDKFYFPAPDNEDTILRAKAGMYDFSLIQSVPGWTLQDKNNFIKLIQKISQNLKTTELKNQISELQRSQKIANKSNKLRKLKKELNNVDKMSLKDIALPISEDYDWDYIANKLNHRHKPQEYRSLWRLFLHPTINKSSWTKDEHSQLQKLVEEKKCQDWEAIALELNTGRSAYQCFVYYRTNMGNTFVLHKWTKDEEEYLKRLIEYYRQDNYIPWTKIAASMENRTKVQIYNKYLRLEEQRKGRFLPEEDAVILSFTEKYGPDFKRMIWYLPGRSITQCRVRYQVLCKKRVSIEWTVEEDKKLVQLMANQDSFKNYSSLTKHFPGKDRINIRSRYVVLEKWMLSHPNLDIIHAPRRPPRLLNRGHLTDNLHKAVENLKKRMESELKENKSKVTTMLSSELEIDNAIINIFVKHQIKIEESRRTRIDNLESNMEASGIQEMETETVNETNLKKVLILLKAKLNKEKFIKSSMATKYPELLQSEICMVQKKTYSKKENGVPVQTIKNVPDIWGNNRLGKIEYVLPPNYATITGCRKIISFISDISSDTDICKNISRKIKHNEILKEQISLLIERFHRLFLWPLLLSNISPRVITGNEIEPTVSYQPPIKKQIISYKKEDYALALPKHSDRDKIINDVIDLPETVYKEDTTVKEGFNTLG